MASNCSGPSIYGHFSLPDCITDLSTRNSGRSSGQDILFSMDYSFFIYSDSYHLNLRELYVCCLSISRVRGKLEEFRVEMSTQKWII